MLILYIVLGGAVGTLLRYLLGGWVHTWAGTGVPWGTFAVNVAGSLVLGIAMRASEPLLVSPEMRGFVTIGFCGAFTTFSTYTYETFALLQKGEWARAGLYALGSLMMGLLAMIAGYWTAAGLLRTGG